MATSAPCSIAANSLSGLVDRRGQVGVGEQHHVAVRVQHAVAHAVSFAAIAGVLQQPDIGMQPRKTARTTSAVSSVEPSFTTMISLCKLPLADVVEDLGQRYREPFALVVSRNYEAVSQVIISNLDALIVCQLSRCVNIGEQKLALADCTTTRARPRLSLGSRTTYALRWPVLVRCHSLVRALRTPPPSRTS